MKTRRPSALRRAPSWPTEKWAPSKWGADDKAGSSNHTKNPANVRKALATIKQYKVLTIGKYYHREAPAFGPRGWQMTIPGTPTGGPFGAAGVIYHDEHVAAEIGQVGTQFDGPGHIGVRTSQGDMFYNGRNREDAVARMRRALTETVIEGVKTTIPFHLRLLAHQAFLQGRFTSADSTRLSG